MTNFSENDLIIHSLKIIKKYPQGIETKDLIQILRLTLDPSGEDLEILSGRSDDKFSQKARNLKSHKTLEKKGFAKFFDNRFYITDGGIKFVDGYENGDELKMLSINIHEEWPLTVRTSNALKNENIVFVGDLLIYEPKRLLSFPNFGKRSLKELEELMMENNINWNKIDADNPRWYELRETLLSKIRNKKDNGARLNQNIIGTKSLLKDFNNFKKISHSDKIFIELDFDASKVEALLINDINEIVSLLEERMAITFKSRFGFQEDHKTLAELGKQFGITRERVRQIETKLKRSLRSLGNIDKNSLIDFFNKYESISFHKLFPKLNKYFNSTRSSNNEITRSKFTIFIECFCGVEEQYFKTPERELLDFDNEKLKEIFTITPSGVSRDNFFEIIKENYGYNDFVTLSAIEFMEKKGLIKISDKKIYPIELNKYQEVANILLQYPNGLHWKKIAIIGNKSFSKNKWDLERIVGDASFNMISNKYIYLSDRGTYRLFNLCPEIKNRNEIINTFKNYLIEKKLDQATLEEAFQNIIKLDKFKNLNFYDARAIIKKFGPEKNLYHTGISGTNTIGLNKNLETISLRDKILKLIGESSEEISQKYLTQSLQKTDEALPIDIHLNDLVDEMKIFRVNPGIYLNFDNALSLCDKDEVKIFLDNCLENFEFITNGFMRESLNRELGYDLSNSYYSSLARVLAKENNWFYGTNFLSKKMQKSGSLENYLKNNFDKDLSNNENFDEITKKIGISRRSFDNIIYQFNLIENTDWIHQDD